MPWHTEPNHDLESRRQMITLIANYLEKRHGKPPDPQDALVATARKLEVALYKASKCKQEYMETRSLSSRIRELERSGNFNADPAVPAKPVANAAATTTTIPSSSTTTGGVGGATEAPSTTVSTNAADLKIPPPPSAAPSGATPSGTPSLASSAAQAAASASAHAEVLKQRRQRLLLLKHASKCTEDDGKCGNHWCPQMKKLWQHVAQCKVPDCPVPHCVSSHYVLGHYHRCKDKECPVCKPVRDESARRRLEAQAAAAASNGSRIPVARPPLGALPARDSQTDVYAHNRKVIESAPNNTAIDPRFARGARDGTGPSLPLSMNRKAVEQHVDSLKVEHMQQLLFPLLRKLMEHSKYNMGTFNQPVDPIRDNVPDYLNVIKKPMDFGTIRRRLEDGRYRKIVEFEADVRLVFDNATEFNPPRHFIHECAIQLRNYFDVELKKIKQKLTEPTTPRRGGECPLCKSATCEKCVLCERGCIPFEPKILFCAGSCQGRISRNATFYSQPGTALNWCSDCHDKKKNEPFVTDLSTNTTYPKSDLIKRKHDEMYGEPWVCCDACGHWAHQTCALFNNRKQNPQNKSDRYVCPKCLTRTEYTPAAKVPAAEDLEHTRLSKFLEMWVRSKLGEALDEEKKNPPKIRGEDPPPASAVTIRVLSNHDETFQTKPFARAVGGFPDTLSYRSRAIFLFQHLDGVDVLLFVMYVQEYGSDAPPPNRGKVYIAYLDSVHFFRPRHHRTLVYHELLLAYLEYARRQGFTSCYIWACPPPNKKDDYILHCHPEDQRVPSHERLRMWYHEMIKRGATEHIVLSSCALFEEHYEVSMKKASNVSKKKENRPKSAGNIANKAGSGKNDRNLQLQKSASVALESQSQSDLTAGLAGALFDGDDDDALDDINFEDMGNPPPALTPAPAANGASSSATALTPFRRASSSPVDDAPLFLGLRKHDLELLDPDELDLRRKEKLAALFQMPLFDGDYWPNEFEDVSLDAAKKNRERFGATAMDGDASKKGGRKAGSAGDAITVQRLIETGEIKNIDGKAVMLRIGEYLESMKADFLVVKLAHECSACGSYLLRGRWECRHPECINASGFNRPAPFALCEKCYLKEITKIPEKQHGGEAQLARPVASAPAGTAGVEAESGAAETEAAKKVPEDDETTGGSENDEKASKRDSENWDKQPLGCTRLVSALGTTHQLCFVDEHLPLKTPRTDKTFKNHLLDTRHAFLSLCTGNRYAFNQLRRAKHTTMMILYHLHNPDAPAHLYSCNMCNEDIIVGHRYNCAICSGGDFDLCQNCARRANHEHRLTPIEVTRTVDQEMSESVRKQGVEQRRKRQRSLQVFLNALIHASQCDAEAGECNEVACAKMKELLQHRTNCKVRVRGGCEICRRVLCLVQMHARGTEHAPPCTRENCPVPHCDDLKKHLKQKEESAASGALIARPASGGTGPAAKPGQESKTKESGTKNRQGGSAATGQTKKKQKGASEEGDAAPKSKKRPLPAAAASAEPAAEPLKPLKIKIKVPVAPASTGPVSNGTVANGPAGAAHGDHAANGGDDRGTVKRARVSTPKAAEANKKN